MDETDAILLEQLRQGDQAAFETLFLRHYGQVYRVLYGVVASREAAEDLVQETFLALYRQPPTGELGGGLGAWLCRVAVNRGYNALRGAQREQTRLSKLDIDAPILDPQTEAIRAEERTRVRATLARLSERQATLLLLRHNGLSYQEIAAVLEVAPSSIGTLLARAERAFLAAFEHTDVAPDQIVEARIA